MIRYSTIHNFIGVFTLDEAFQMPLEFEVHENLSAKFPTLFSGRPYVVYHGG